MMMNNAITESLEVPVPANAVWWVVSDIAALPEVLSGMTRLEVEGSDPSPRVGLTWTQTRVIAGRTGSERLRVAEFDDGTSYVTRGASHGFEYVTTWTVEPLDAESSRLTCTFLGIPTTAPARMMMRIFGRFGSSASRAAIRVDLDDIARAATGSDR